LKKLIPIFTLLFLLSSCDDKCEIFLDRVESNKPLDHGFIIYKISVSEKTEKGIPSKYEVISGISCDPIKNFAVNLKSDRYSDNERSIIEQCRKSNDSIVNLNNGVIKMSGDGIAIDEYKRNQAIIDSLYKLRFPFTPQKTIYFNTKSDNYVWTYCNTNGLSCWYDYERGQHETLPEEFLRDQWYVIDFSNVSNIKDKLFFKINKDETIEQHYYFNANQWGV
jgi:hypothetical protein